MESISPSLESGMPCDSVWPIKCGRSDVVHVQECRFQETLQLLPSYFGEPFYKVVQLNPWRTRGHKKNWGLPTDSSRRQSDMERMALHPVIAPQLRSKLAHQLNAAEQLSSDGPGRLISQPTYRIMGIKKLFQAPKFWGWLLGSNIYIIW